MKYQIVITTKLMRMMGEELYRVYNDYDKAVSMYNLAVSDLKVTDNTDGTIICLKDESGRCIDCFKKEEKHEEM